MSDLGPALPDAEALLSQFLRAQDEIIDVIPSDLDGARVYTVIPEKPTWPIVLLRRIGGVPRVARPLVLDDVLIQVDAYGGTKKAAHDLVELVRSCIAARIEGVHELGNVTGYSFGNLSWLPDNAYTPSRARYVADVELFVKPLFNVGS